MTWWNRRGDQLRAEMQQHIELETQANIEAGLSPEEARYAALRKFGSFSIAREESRDVWGWLWLERLVVRKNSISWPNQLDNCATISRCEASFGSYQE